MKKTEWQRVQELFAQALDRAPEERAAWLEEVCPDPRLRSEVTSLLRADSQGHPMLEGFALNEVGLDGPGLAQGATVDSWRILRVIGEGGMGMVYLAERADGLYEQTAALKVVKKGMDSAEILARFSAERQILARLEHPRISRLLDGGVTEDGQSYFVMEYVDGQPIDDYCDERSLDVDARLELFADVCEAVQYAHGQLVVHRDLKPDNILVTADGDIKLLDFGIGKLLTGVGEEAGDLTRMGSRVLTPAYASPEQLRGEAVGTSTDVYSLGVVLHELLTGVRPENRREDEPVAGVLRPSERVTRLSPEVGRGIAAQRASQIERLAKRIRGDLDTITIRALEPDPTRRFVSVEALGADIRRYLDGLPVLARPDSLSYRLGKFVRRNVAALSAAAIVLVTITGLVTFYTLRLQEAQALAEAEAERAATEAERARTEADAATRVSGLFINTFRMASPQMQSRVVTAMDMLDWAVMNVDTLLVDFPEMHSDLLASVGRVYTEHGRLDSAEGALRRVVELNEEIFDEPNTLRIIGLSNLATLLQEKGDYEESERYFLEASEVAGALPTEDPFATAFTLNNLAKLRLDIGAYEAAEGPLEQAAAIYAEHAPENGWVGVALRNQGRAVRMQGRMEEADSLYMLALADLREYENENDPGTAELLYEIAEHRITVGNLTEARQYSDEALDMRRYEFTEGHHSIGHSLAQQARLYRLEGDLAAARTAIDEGITILEEFLDADHPWVLAAHEEHRRISAGG